MLVSWPTVAAQVVNFLVLVLLLRRFLYGPITRVMAQRQRHIDEQLAAAERMRAEAAALGAEHRAALEALRGQREEQLRALHEELGAVRHAQQQELRAELDDLQHRWWAAVERERDGFVVELRQRVADQVVAVTRRALEDLAGESLEVRITERFLERLGALDPAQRATLLDAVADDGGRLDVRTGFPLPAELEQRLVKAVDVAVGPVPDLHVEVVPDRVGGVELRAGGRSLAWTFDDYLESLERAVAAALAGEPEDHDRA
jgi:F-type H+-transporting ATPase subunit b